MFPLVGLAASSIAAMVYVSRKKREEGFAPQRGACPNSLKMSEGFVQAEMPLNSQAQAIFDSAGQEVIRSNAANYSRAMNVINPLTNPNFMTDRQIADTEADLQSAVGDISLKDGKVGVGINKDVLLPRLENTVADYVRRCEAISGKDPKAYDDTWFAGHCGICHDGGTNNAGETHVGGLYKDPKSIEVEEYETRLNGLKYPAYKPSLGSCAPGKFSTNKEQAERINRRLECEKQQNYDVAGCAQCDDDKRFYYVDPKTPRGPISIVLVGEGDLEMTSGNDTIGISLSAKPQVITPASPLKEGDIVYLAVSKKDGLPNVAGYIVGKTITGESRMDVARLADVDLETSAKPRFAGVAEVNSEYFNVLRPGSGKTALKLQVYVPYTYLETSEPEAQQCGSAPFLTDPRSAEKLSSGPCFVKGAAPGTYSLECIQQIFKAAGCGPEGKGYPTTLEAARSWAKTDTIGMLAGKVYDTALRADSGVDAAGVKLTLAQRHEAAQFCNGRSYLTVCDAYNKETGPLGSDCIAYLYKEAKRCSADGIGAPVGADGLTNEAAVKEAQKAGGVEAVKAYYASMYQRAMDNSLRDADREIAVKQCFGTGFVRDAVKAPDQTIKKQSVLANVSANQKSAYEKVNFTYPYGGNFSPVAVLGPYGMAPWGSSADFSDKTAMWIWNTFNANETAPVFKNVDTPAQDRNIPAFYYVYENKGNSIVRARVDFMIDNIGDLYVNDELIALGHYGGWTGSWRPSTSYIGNQKTITLKPGKNLIKFVANNAGGPAGFMMACFGPDGKLLFHTDKSWFFKDAYGKVSAKSVVDLDNWPVYQAQVVANVIKTDTKNLKSEMWNPVGSAGHESPIVYRLKVDFGRDVKLTSIKMLTFGDNVHDPTGVRIYTDETKAGLLATSGSLQGKTETENRIDTSYKTVSGVYIELDKSTQYQIWLQRIVFVEMN